MVCTPTTRRAAEIGETACNVYDSRRKGIAVRADVSCICKIAEPNPLDACAEVVSDVVVAMNWINDPPTVTEVSRD
jgi:hypothetical protein